MYLNIPLSSTAISNLTQFFLPRQLCSRTIFEEKSKKYEKYAPKVVIELRDRRPMQRGEEHSVLSDSLQRDFEELVEGIGETLLLVSGQRVGVP